MLYFAYGSNLSTPRLRQRISSAEIITSAMLPDHQLKFHKVGTDDSGKGDIHFTATKTDEVYGVVYSITESNKKTLDQIEGLNHGYAQKKVTVFDHDGQAIDALSYYATEINPLLLPYDWYLQHILYGAQEHDLPENHIKQITQTPTQVDANKQRHQFELTIYSET